MCHRTEHPLRLAESEDLVDKALGRRGKWRVCRAHFRLLDFAALLLCRVDPVGQQSPRVVTPGAGILKAHVGIGAKAQPLFHPMAGLVGTEPGERLWIIPGNRAKNGVVQIVPLAPAVGQELDQLALAMQA